MIRATAIVPPSDGRVGDALVEITLTRKDRYRRRIVMTADDGFEFLLDLAEANYLPDGSGLLLDDGRIIRVRAAAEALARIGAPDRLTLARIIWHIGNRHTPAEITEDAIFIQPDHVLSEMVRGLGGTVQDVERPFEPEGGAYGGHGPLEKSHHHHSHDHHQHSDGHG